MIPASEGVGLGAKTAAVVEDNSRLMTWRRSRRTGGVAGLVTGASGRSREISDGLLVVVEGFGFHC